MLDRLIELMRKWGNKNNDSFTYESVADSLLANGVIVPPCKLGDTVWYISTENPHVAFQKELKARTVKEPIEGILITKDGFYINTYNMEEAKNYFDKVGEDYAYLTKAAAEAEIKRRGQE